MTAEMVRLLMEAIAPVMREIAHEIAQEAVQDVTGRVALVETHAPRLVRAEANLDAMTGILGTVRERLAVVETRPASAGPPGPPGADGTLEQLRCEYDGERTIRLVTKAGTVIEGGTITLPIPLFQGPHDPTRTYQKGDLVQWNGGGYLCIAPVEAGRPHEGAKGWRLFVKPGRDGKDGKP